MHIEAAQFQPTNQQPRLLYLASCSAQYEEMLGLVPELASSIECCLSGEKVRGLISGRLDYAGVMVDSTSSFARELFALVSTSQSSPRLILTGHDSDCRAAQREHAAVGIDRVVVRPWARSELLDAVHWALGTSAADEVIETGAGPLVAAGTASRSLLVDIQGAARVSCPVLITGEHGVGKDFVARAIHRLGGRSQSSFHSFNMAERNTSLLEAELFGHVRGAFTGASTDKPGIFERASGGTLLLNEIGNIPLDLQGKLLGVLDDRWAIVRRLGGSKEIRVDARLITATNADLGALVRAGRFRADLLARLDILSIVVPPLRERREDVWPLFAQFWSELCATNQRPLPIFDTDARAFFVTYPWPGNARELRTCAQRLLAWPDQQSVDVPLLTRVLACPVTAGAQHRLGLRARIDQADREHKQRLYRMVQVTIDQHDGNVYAVARAERLSRGALTRLLRRVSS